MKKLIALIRRAPKRTSALVAILAAAIIVPATLFAWGPSRPTYTTAVPADHITFNSITDNPSHGDEQNFVQIREASASNTTYADSVSLTAGNEYVVYMYFHNNAAENLNLVAKGSYAKTSIPAVVAKNSNANLVGYVGANNSSPLEVWDEAKLNNPTNGDMAMRFVPDSATIHSFGAVDGATMSDSIISTGAPIGYSSLNGDVPGCNEFAGYVTFRIKAEQANFTVDKQVRLAGSSTWSENVNANPGDNVEYMIEYKNTGTTEQKNVLVKDVLPQGVSYIAGSTILKNANFPSGKTVSDNLTNGTGINVGTYLPGGNVFLKFTAKVAGSDQLVCGVNTFHNVVTIETSNGSKEDSANVTVSKTCTTVPPVSPPELPRTGASDNIAMILGAGLLTAGISYFVASRRKLSAK